MSSRSSASVAPARMWSRRDISLASKRQTYARDKQDFPLRGEGLSLTDLDVSIRCDSQTIARSAEMVRHAADEAKGSFVTWERP